MTDRRGQGAGVGAWRHIVLATLGLQRLEIIASIIVSLLLLIAVPVFAASQTYQYDPNGRLQSVTNSAGQTAHYVYDSRGNLIRIESTSASQLAITSVTPNNGAIGSQVTVNGSGFTASTSANTVSFNGTAASVLSATSGQLLVQVPMGATSGPITITNALGSATSAESFAVTQVGQPPVITAISPSVAVKGSLVTITGQYLDPVADQTTVTMDGLGGILIGVSDTQITFLPPNSGSGTVTVTTPYGSATSSTSVTVVPFGVDPSSVSSEYPPLQLDGTTQQVSLPAPNDYAALLFQGSAGEYLTLTLSSTNGASLNGSYSVYTPSGALVTSGMLLGTTSTLTLPQLPESGTYLIMLGSGSTSAQISISVLSDLLGSMSEGGDTENYATTAISQSVSVGFNGTVGDSVGIGVGNLSLAQNSVTWATAYLYGPTGAQVASCAVNAGGSGGCALTVASLPQTGTYRIRIVPGGAATMNVSVSLSQAMQSSLSADGSTSSYTTTWPAQFVSLQFSGNAGQYLTAALSSLALSSGTGFTELSVYAPNGSQFASQSCSTSASGCVVNLPNLPTTGTYTLQVSLSVPATMSFSLAVPSDLSVAIPPDGSAATVSTTVAGQAALLTFSGTAGQSFGVIRVHGLAFTPSSIFYTAVNIYQPDGTLLSAPYFGYQSCGTYGDCIVNLGYLPETGTYQLQLVPNGAATMNFSVSGTPYVSASLPTDGSTPTYTTTVPGQGVTASITGTQGQNLGVIQILGLTDNVDVYVYGPDGSILVSQACSTSSACGVNLSFLPLNGKYLLEVVSSDGGTMSFSLGTAANVSGALALDGSSQSFTTTLPGQSVDLSFNGTAGDNTGNIQLTALSTSGNGTASLLVYSPTGAQIASQWCYSTPCSVNLSYLPVSGTYQVQIVPFGSQTMSTTVSVSPNTTWTMPASGASVAVSTTTAGQVAYVRFSGTAGGGITLAIQGLAVTPSSSNSYINVSIYEPNGSTPVQQFCQISQGTCSFRIGQLSVTGNYQMQIAPAGASTQTMSFNAAAIPDLEVSVPADGTSHNLSNSVSGQAVSLNLAGQAGQNLDLILSNLSFGSSSVSQATLAAYTPNGAQLGSQIYCYATSSLCTLHLGNLPATGNYQIQAVPTGLSSMQFTAGVAPDVSGTLTTNGTQTNASTSIAGQAIALSFAGTAGQILGLGVTGTTSSFSGTVQVYKPDGSALLSNPQYCFGACSDNLGTLPQSGTYEVVITPYTLNTISVSVAVAPPATPVTISIGGSPVSLSANSTGPALVSFSATMGQRVGFWLTSSTFAGSYSVTLTNPDGTVLSSAYQYGPTTPVFVGPYALEQTGTYTIAVGGSGYSGTFSLQAVLVPEDVTTSITLDGGAVTASAGSAGQGIDFVFNGTTGQTVYLQIAGDSLSSASGVYSISILNPDRTQLLSSTQGTGSSVFGPYTLPQNGTYVIAINPGGATGSITAQLVSQLQNSSDSTTVNGASATMVAVPSTAGGNLSFTATAGQRVGLNIIGSSVASYTLSLQNPDGSTVFSTGTNPYALFFPYVLQQTGTYTLNLQTTGSVGTMTLQVVSVPADVTGTLVEGGSPITVSTSAELQAADLSFTGTAGQQVTVNLSNFNLTGSIYATYGYSFLSILNPDGTQLLSPTVALGGGSSGPYTLQQSGTYTIVVMPIYATGSMTIGLTGS